MNLNEIDLLKLSHEQAIKINSKLPKPNENIVGHFSVLPVTIAMGCQIKIINDDDIRFWLQKETCFSLDEKKISYPCFTNDMGDATWDFLENGGDHYCIGTGSLGGKFKNHVDMFYAPQFFRFTEQNFLDINIKARQGWCCTMSKKRDMRDLIVNILEKEHLDKFQGNEWFCYDGIDPNRKNLIKLMYRTPGSGDVPSIEWCNGINDQKSKFWNNLKFVDTFSINRTSYEGLKNVAGGHIGCLLGPWHRENLIELVPEATHRFFECTEKIVKPMRAGMPFVVIGCEKFLYRLRKMGFKTFHPFIDESYDIEKDWKKRTKMAINSMFEFNQNPENLEQIEKICKHNQEIIKKIGKHDPIRRIAKKLKILISFNETQ